MKKLLIVALFSLLSLESHAVDFMCRSLNTGYLITYKDSEKVLYYKDRFSNELNAWDALEIFENQNDIEYFFEKEKILVLDLESQSANALFNNDASFQCRILLP